MTDNLPQLVTAPTEAEYRAFVGAVIIDELHKRDVVLETMRRWGGKAHPETVKAIMETMLHEFAEANRILLRREDSLYEAFRSVPKKLDDAKFMEGLSQKLHSTFYYMSDGTVVEK